MSHPVKAKVFLNINLFDKLVENTRKLHSSLKDSSSSALRGRGESDFKAEMLTGEGDLPARQPGVISYCAQLAPMEGSKPVTKEFDRSNVSAGPTPSAASDLPGVPFPTDKLGVNGMPLHAAAAAAAAASESAHHSRRRSEDSDVAGKKRIKKDMEEEYEIPLYPKPTHPTIPGRHHWYYLGPYSGPRHANVVAAKEDDSDDD
jgi:hypothetical protein